MGTIKSNAIMLKDGLVTIDGGIMQEPGFLRCWVTAKVDGKEYKSCATAGFSPDEIKPTVQYPGDFVEFWDGWIIHRNFFDTKFFVELVLAILYPCTTPKI